jgi:hypothetical protein
MHFVAHLALFARLCDACCMPYCSLVSVIVRGFLSCLLSAFFSWLHMAGRIFSYAYCGCWLFPCTPGRSDTVALLRILMGMNAF